MKRKHTMELGFKGKRNYVHGTSMFDESMTILARELQGEISSIEFLIHRMTDSNLVLQWQEADNAGPVGEDVAIMRLTVGCRPIFVRIVAVGGSPQTRSPYDESLVVDHCDIDRESKRITLLADTSNYTVIEILVAMTKALHLSVLDKPEGSNWVFCRWDSPRWPLSQNLTGVNIVLKQALGTRLTRCDVHLEGILLGQIFFSAKVT